MIERLVNRVFSGEPEEVRKYGFENVQVQHWFAEFSERWIPRIRHVGGYLNNETEEEDLLIIDDAWLRLA